MHLTVFSWHDSQMHQTDKHSEHSSIICLVWPNGWVFVYELSGSGFGSCWINILQFVFTICQVKDYRIVLKLSCSPFVLTLNQSGTSLSTLFSAWFLNKHISFFIFYYLTKFHCLVVFISWDIGQYLYCTCLLTRLCRHKFWN